MNDWYGDQEERSSVRTVPFVIDDGLPRRLTSHLYFYVVYYKGIKGVLNRRLLSECRCDETLKVTRGIYRPRIHWVPRGTGTPKDRDEVNRREVSDCDG
jgi:hypothetical protein